MGEYFCSACGRRLGPEARFCAACGTAVPEVATSGPGAPGPGVAGPGGPGSGAGAPLPPPPPKYAGGYAPGPAPYPAPYAAPYPPPRAATNGYAIASLVLSLVSLCGIGSILAIVFGNMAKRQIRTEGGEGSGLATAGIIIGWVGLVLVIVYAIFFFGFVLNARTTRTYP